MISIAEMIVKADLKIEELMEQVYRKIESEAKKGNKESNHFFDCFLRAHRVKEVLESMGCSVYLNTVVCNDGLYNKYALRVLLEDPRFVS